MDAINPWAVLVAAISSFLIGGLWYSHKVFGRIWQQQAGDARPPGQGHPAKVFGLSLVFALIAAFVFAWLIPPPEDAAMAALQGLLVGFGLVGCSFGVNYQFANRSFKLLLIDGGYHTAQFLVYGLVIGLWR